MRSFEIKKNDAGQRLDKFISKSLPVIPQALMYRYIRTKRIKLNGKRAEISSRLAEGDIVDMYIGDEFFAEGKAKRYDFLRASGRLDIIYEDVNILLLNKSAGLLSHPDGEEFADTLITRARRYLYEKGEYLPEDESSFAPALANRIDRNTAGIVMAAKNAESLRVLNEKIKNREIIKRYLCVVHGKMPKKNDTLRGYLYKDGEKNMVFVHGERREGDREIKTRYEVLAERGGLSLLEIDLLTGRTHQIRAHLASAGHPILGDGKYGSRAQNKKWGYKKQFLCSYKLIFNFQSGAGILDYLNNREFEVPEVWFREAFLNGEL